MLKPKRNKDGSFAVYQEEEHSKGGLNVLISCPKCGKPITKTDMYGMFCKDECERPAAIKAAKAMNKYLNTLMPGIGKVF